MPIMSINFINKYPPMMKITRMADGTMRYSGIVVEMLDFYSRALGIRSIINRMKLL